jgi:hypothetical protein
MEMYNYFKDTGAWPDGGAYLDQPNVLVEVFNIIDSQIALEQKAEIEKRGNKG